MLLSGVNWNSLHHNPVKGVDPAASSARDSKSGFTTELAAEVIDDAWALMKCVDVSAAFAEPTQKVFIEARRNHKCRDKEARSVGQLFAEDGRQGRSICFLQTD